MLPKQAIEEFKTIYLKRYGLELSDTEATEKAYKVFNFFKQIISDDVGIKDVEVIK